MPRSARTRAYCFTWNNYPDTAEATLRALETRYIIFGKERAPGTGTPHLQGYVYWPNAKTVSACRRALPGCHVIMARGSPSSNRSYCSKEGDYVECGDLPSDAEAGGRDERSRWDLARLAAQEGRFETICSDIYLRCYGTIQRIFSDHMPRPMPLPGVCGLWIWGESGCGKTRAVVSAFPDCFIKPRNCWWDGYKGEAVVLVDDVDKFDVRLGGYFKHWADFTPFIGEVKGRSNRIRPSKLIVTSQYTIEEIWEDRQTRDALGRRFTVINKVAGQDIILV